jgi:hypothetical protein
MYAVFKNCGHILNDLYTKYGHEYIDLVIHINVIVSNSWNHLDFHKCIGFIREN